ncbi:2,5-dichloro-2,5-cyclohexadiene-1,4-diol dehydrogenase [Fusarium sporotrichioides]|uniref:2,5-dichloro-2,5-cyclohexadiene-1,4-diol dehydrogenase n=1 Tax=Fusarium sporotrichioides TaxID=5514 RepID=A0A395RLS4_FUSSP|nr:2,5-dichloro-2,5-cyclohexadiene-1,4-diol dehydrogenase [Fusarium sporotrichioides]
MGGEFSGTVALVTGASGGIGFACARLLASKGASVALLDLVDTTVQSQELTQLCGTPAMPIKLDVTNVEGVKDAVGKVVSWKGRLDFAVNAAGILPAGANIDGVDPSVWGRVINVNLNGTFYCMQQEIQVFLELGISGSIVNLSSDAGTIGTVGCAAYVASKHAVNGLTKTAALEYAKKGIRVNVVAPGNIATPMLSHLGITAEELGHATQPSGKLGDPKKVAELVIFLLSERADFMTGSIVAIDGGTTVAGYSNGDTSQAFMSAK